MLAFIVRILCTNRGYYGPLSFLPYNVDTQLETSYAIVVVASYK